VFVFVLVENTVPGLDVVTVSVYLHVKISLFFQPLSGAREVFRQLGNTFFFSFHSLLCDLVEAHCRLKCFILTEMSSFQISGDFEGLYSGFGVPV